MKSERGVFLKVKYVPFGVREVHAAIFFPLEVLGEAFLFSVFFCLSGRNHLRNKEISSAFVCLCLSVFIF